MKISGGELQRIGIARALYHDPQILILDESTSSLDIQTERKILEIIHAIKSDLLIFIVSHRLSTTEICDKVYKLENGKLNFINKQNIS